jgi:hypothetical protein
MLASEFAEFALLKVDRIGQSITVVSTHYFVRRNKATPARVIHFAANGKARG